MINKHHFSKAFSILLLVLLLTQTMGCTTDQQPQNTQSAQPQTPQNTPTRTTPLPAPKARIQNAQIPTYTIAWISDTQHYSVEFTDTYIVMTQYLKNNRQKMHLGYVVHTGDFVDKDSEIPEWEIAKNAMNELSGIPYGVLAGNHDVGKKQNYTNYCKYFGEKEFSKYPYYGGSMLDNRNHYDLITMGNTEYVFVYLGYRPDKRSIRWANEIFQKYADRIGVLCLHEYLNTDSSLLKAALPLQQQVVKPNPNVYLVLCGHRYAQDCITAQFDDNGDGSIDRTVYQCIANYQEIDTAGGSGYMRFIEINENTQTMCFYTYSPLLDQYRPIPDTSICRKSSLPIPWL